MKRLLYILLLMMPLMASAQNKSLEFYYIAHDRSTPVNELCDRLEQVYYTAMSYDREDESSGRQQGRVQEDNQ